MFIGGLSWQTTPESIREYFSIFGELAEVMVMKDPATRYGNYELTDINCPILIAILLSSFP